MDDLKGDGGGIIGWGRGEGNGRVLGRDQYWGLEGRGQVGSGLVSIGRGEGRDEMVFVQEVVVGGLGRDCWGVVGKGVGSCGVGIGGLGREGEGFWGGGEVEVGKGGHEEVNGYKYLVEFGYSKGLGCEEVGGLSR